jgi:hypothetical protein
MIQSDNIVAFPPANEKLVGQRLTLPPVFIVGRGFFDRETIHPRRQARVVPPRIN